MTADSQEFDNPNWLSNVIPDRDMIGFPYSLIRFRNVRKLTIIFFVFLYGCSPGHKPPEGYVEACYGGNFAKNLSGAEPIYSAELDIDDSQWPKLFEILKLVSDKHGLRFFNDTRHTESLKMISISLCSERGLFLHADKRIWHVEGQKQDSSLPLMVNIFTYRNSESWTDLAKEVDRILSKEWPKALDNKPKITTQLRNS